MPSLLSTNTACVRLETLSALRMAAIWVFTVPSARPSSRQIILFGLPCTSSVSTSDWRPVSPRSPMVMDRPPAATLARIGGGAAGTGSAVSSAASACGGIYTAPASTSRRALTRIGVEERLEMKPMAPQSIAWRTVCAPSLAESTTTGTSGRSSRTWRSRLMPDAPGSIRSSSISVSCAG